MKNLVKISSSNLPTEFGDYTIHVFKDIRTSIEHVALIFLIGFMKRAEKFWRGFKESMRIVFDKHMSQWNYAAIPDTTISEVA
jgi:hypothetical protein